MYHYKLCKHNPYQATVGEVSLGYFATAEEAALRIARSPEVQAAAVAVAAEEQRRQEKATEARQRARHSRRRRRG